VNIEQRWNDIDRGKPKDSEKNLSQCHFVYHKSHMDRQAASAGFRSEKPVTNRLSCSMADFFPCQVKSLFTTIWRVYKFRMEKFSIYAG
jgi:hypothetical protein